MERTQDLGGFNKLVRGRHGTFVANENDIYVGRALLRYGEYSELEFELLRQLCQAGQYVAEVGANVGALTVPLAHTVGPTGRVVAYEPQPVIFQTLCANVALSSLTNVDCINAGIGDANGSIALARIDYGEEGNFGGIQLKNVQNGVLVDVKKFDECYPYEQLALMKVDVEGMEQKVLEGAAQTIDRCRPILYVENDRIKQSSDLIRLIQDLGYRLWWHTPRLFNPNNFFGNPDNIYKNIVSVNMVCVHRSHAVQEMGFREIVDPNEHVMNRS